MQWAAHWPAAGDINRWDTHVVLVVDLASDRGSIPRASTFGSFSNDSGVQKWAPLFVSPSEPGHGPKRASRAILENRRRPTRTSSATGVDADARMT